jgi:UDP-glucose 4-epimerase
VIPARGRVLLTGASGFAGAALARSLSDAGWTVRAPLRRPVELPSGSEAVPIGELDAVDWAPLLAGVDAVVHGAGLAHAGPGLDETPYRRINRDATLRLGEAAAGRVRRFVFLSSIRAQSGPTSPAVLTEDDPPRPTDAYGRSKLAAEEGLARLDLAATSLRPVVIYGPGVKANMALLLRLARLPLPLPLAGLTAPRSLLSLDNLSSAVRHALEAPEALPGAFIVADPGPLGLGEIVAAMRAGLGRRPMLLPAPAAIIAAALRMAGRGEAWDRISGPLAADPGRLIRRGWQPPVASTREGLRHWLSSPGHGR